ncbi:MAG: hypothetical protein ACRDKT_13715 [Actinomycetota bacterium]
MGDDQDKLESLGETIVGASDEMAATAEHMADSKSLDIDLRRIQQKLREAHEAIEESRVRVAKALEAAQEDRDRHKHQ